MEKFFINKLHNSTKRNYLERMINDKVACMRIAKKYGYDYWDGNRQYGYGGYKYIPGRMEKVAKQIIQTYSLTENSKILDLGCGKGYLLYELKKLIPSLEVCGLDISSYAIKNSKKEIKEYLKVRDVRIKLPYKKKSFDLVFSFGLLHNFSLFSLIKTIKEITRVGKKQFIMVESYRNDQELFNLQCWALTCEMFLSRNEWINLFKSHNYQGDFEFIYFK
jgi:ubiquinone/menaquinone biosynthesis C-methylase UbiE